jgi:hypothetical protein
LDHFSLKNGAEVRSALGRANLLFSHFMIRSNVKSGQAQETTLCTNTWIRRVWRWVAMLPVGGLLFTWAMISTGGPAIRISVMNQRRSAIRVTFYVQS